jgi:hypothetical protein
MDAAVDDAFIDDITFSSRRWVFADRHSVPAAWRQAPRRPDQFRDRSSTTSELLCSGLTAIKPDVLTVKPSDVGVKSIGHFGFFRPETATHSGAVWRSGCWRSDPR